jgi:hypothetical protein
MIHKITLYINVSLKIEARKFLNLKNLLSKEKKKEFSIMRQVYSEAGNQTINRLCKVVWTMISNIVNFIDLLSQPKLKFQKLKK